MSKPSTHPLDQLPVPPEPPEERRPNVDDRGYLRFFAFWLANGTLIVNVGDDDPPYDELLGLPGPALGELFTVMMAQDHLPTADAQAWLYTWATTGEKPPVPALPPEAPPWKQVVVDFATALGERSLDADLLALVAEEDLQGLLMDWGGSPLERVFAVLANCLELGPDGAVLNAPWALRRATLAVVLAATDAPEATPPFEEWEGTLWS